MRCPGCNTENPEGAKFCIQCASPLKRVCQKCGFENPPEARFCAQCATSLTRGVAVKGSSRPNLPLAFPQPLTTSNHRQSRASARPSLRYSPTSRDR